MSEVVYFARRQALVKIGMTGHLPTRLWGLNGPRSSVDGMSSEPVEILATMPGGRPVELALHKLFAYLRYDKEWFFLEPPLTDFIAAVAAASALQKAHILRAFPEESRDALAPISLREAVEFGVVPWTLEAAKKRLQRDRRAGSDLVPTVIARLGRTDLFDRAALDAWARGGS